MARIDLGDQPYLIQLCLKFIIRLDSAGIRVQCQPDRDLRQRDRPRFVGLVALQGTDCQRTVVAAPWRGADLCDDGDRSGDLRSLEPQGPAGVGAA